MDALLLKRIENEYESILSVYKKSKAKYQEEKKIPFNFYNLIVRYKNQYREMLRSIESGTLESVNETLSELPKTREQVNDKLTRKNNPVKKLRRYLSNNFIEKKDLRQAKPKDHEHMNILLEELEHLTKISSTSGRFIKAFCKSGIEKQLEHFGEFAPESTNPRASSRHSRDGAYFCH